MNTDRSDLMGGMQIDVSGYTVDHSYVAFEYRRMNHACRVDVASIGLPACNIILHS